MSTSTPQPRRVVPETLVPDGETPVTTCPYCDRPFARRRHGVLHVVEAHPDRASEAERAAYDDAHEEESNDLFVYHLKVMFALGALYAAFVISAVIAFSVAG
ncbi:DUF7410 domain-containing protein [Salinigranum marinum]|uniref:DUF7410 domain-containing protein n=1 Tax=Salinigranum marinum TaxID=1515595 RepID=UPI002989E487|nr:hypothetical protein [Salinigranum marinum]